MSSDQTRDLDPSQLSLVRLDNPYVQMQNQNIRNLFSEFMAFKIEAYSPPIYPATLMMMETIDFVARHYFLVHRELFEKRMLGEIIDNNYFISAFKVVSLSQANFYHLPPTYYHYFSDAHDRWMSDLMQEHKRRGNELLFYSGFAIKNVYRGTYVSQMVKELVGALIQRDFYEFGEADSLAVGVPRLKTDQLWAKMGYRPAVFKGKALPLSPMKIVENELFGLMHLTKPSDWCQQCLDQYKDLLSREITYVVSPILKAA